MIRQSSSLFNLFFFFSQQPRLPHFSTKKKNSTSSLSPKWFFLFSPYFWVSLVPLFFSFFIPCLASMRNFPRNSSPRHKRKKQFIHWCWAPSGHLINRIIHLGTKYVRNYGDSWRGLWDGKKKWLYTNGKYKFSLFKN